MGKHKKDIRSLCGQHAYDMRNAGYQLCRTKNTLKEECDKCYKRGYDYEVKEIAMIEEIREVLLAIEQSLAEADYTPDNRCTDMTLVHLKIANEWQKRKITKPNKVECCECCSSLTACGRKDE